MDEHRARADLDGFLRRIEQEISRQIPAGGEGLTDEQFLIWTMVAHVTRLCPAAGSRWCAKGRTAAGSSEASGFERRSVRGAGQLD